MGRVNWLNPWGRTAEAQRADLWLVNFDGVVDEFRLAGVLNSTDLIGFKSQFYAQSVSLPELAVSAEVVRRDSRPYQMPSWDLPPGPVKMTFLVDIGSQRGQTGYNSELLKLLTVWRAVVRAGRGGMSSENSYTLNSYYSTAREQGGFRLPLHAFDIRLYLLKGPGSPGQDLRADGEAELEKFTDLECSTSLILKQAWLSTIQFGELSYEASTRPFTVSALFYTEDIVLDTGELRRYLDRF